MLEGGSPGGGRTAYGHHWLHKREKMNWQTIATVALTAITTILAATGVLDSESGADISATGASAVTAVASFVAAILGAIKAHKEKKANDTTKDA